MDKYELNKSTFNKLAQQYEARFMYYDGYLHTFDLLITEILKVDAKILEIACGPGNVSKYLLSKKPKYQLYGIDVAVNMVLLARKNNPTATYDVMDCRFLSQVIDSFEAVICAFGLPYLDKKEAIQLIHNSCNLLLPNGVLYISTMEGNYENSEYVKSKEHKESTYVFYHKSRYLKEALVSNDMKILHEFREPYCNSEGKKFVDLFIIAIKKENRF